MTCGVEGAHVSRGTITREEIFGPMLKYTICAAVQQTRLLGRDFSFCGVVATLPSLIVWLTQIERFRMEQKFVIAFCVECIPVSVFCFPFRHTAKFLV